MFLKPIHIFLRTLSVTIPLLLCPTFAEKKCHSYTFKGDFDCTKLALTFVDRGTNPNAIEICNGDHSGTSCFQILVGGWSDAPFTVKEWLDIGAVAKDHPNAVQTSTKFADVVPYQIRVKVDDTQLHDTDDKTNDWNVSWEVHSLPAPTVLYPYAATKGFYWPECTTTIDDGKQYPLSVCVIDPSKT